MANDGPSSSAENSPSSAGSPALIAALCGFVFAASLAVPHKAQFAPGLGVIGAATFCFAANMRGPSPRRLALLFTLPTSVAYAWLQNWLIGITVPGYFGLVAVTSGFTMLAMWLSVRVARRAPSLLLACLGAGVMLAALDFTRGRVFLSGYPWYTLGQPTLDIPGIPTLASLIGMHGVNTLVCLLGAALAVPLVALQTPKPSSSGGMKSPVLRFLSVLLPVLALAMSASLFARVFARTPAAVEDGVPIAVVQTNVPQSNKQFATPEQRIQQFFNAARLTRIAHQEALVSFGEPAAFIAWPETMFPGTALNDQAVATLRGSGVESFMMTADMRDALLALQASINTPLLVGAVAMENARVVPDEEEGYVRIAHDAVYNSAFLLEDGAVAEARYDKIHLTPFGEVMPIISRSDWLEKQLLALGAPGMSFDLESGTEFFRFDIDGVRVATPICFEATIPHICRQLVFEGGERKADILVNLTNDGWFGATDSARRDHLLLARWRAAELATPVVRAANTGMSCFIDASGRVYTKHAKGLHHPGRLGAFFDGPKRTEQVLLARVLPGEGITLYGRTGDVVGWTVFILGCGLTVFALLPAKNRANRPPSPNAVEPIPD